MWRKIRKIFLWTAGSFVALILILAFIIYLMQDKIKAYAVSYINDYLKTELKVSKIDVTFLSTFPNTSLHFKKALIMDPRGIRPYSDTMLFAEDVYLEFSIWDIFSGDYKVRNIEVYNAVNKIYINPDGKENYDIIKETPGKKEEEKFELALRSVKFYRSHFTYENDITLQKYEFFTSEAELKGDFKQKVTDLEFISDLRIKRMRNQSVMVLKNQSSLANLVLHIDKEKQTINFNKGSWKIEKMDLAVNGSIDHSGENTKCDLKISGNNVEITQLLSVMPDKIKSNLHNYRSRGLVNLTAEIKGEAGKNISPEVNAKFHISDGTVLENTTNVSLHNIDLTGSFTNKNAKGKDELNISRFTARFKDGDLDMRYRIVDFSHPEVGMDVKGNFNLKTLHAFFQPAEVDSLTGSLAVDWHMEGKINHPDDSKLRKIDVKKAVGNIGMEKVAIKLTKNHMVLSGIKGDLRINNQDALFDALEGKTGSSDFNLNGAIQNFTSYILSGGEKMNIVAAFNSSHTDIKDFMSKRKITTDIFSAPSTGYKFPENINFNFDIHIHDLVWDQFQANGITGNFKLIDKKLNASGLQVKLADGSCTGNIEVDGTVENTFAVSSKANIENVNIARLFYAFNNFGQKIVNDKNTKGVISATIDFAGFTNGELQFDDDKILVEADVKIKNGELINLQSLKSISEFMRTDKRIRPILKNHADDFESRVSHLRFSDLSNHISIRDGTIHIPKMEIASNALKINFSGTHSFINMIDYRFNFRFLELKTNTSQTEFGYVKDDGTGIKLYIRMYGHIDSPKYEIDKETRKMDFAEAKAKEKSDLKAILKEEFGLFKRDTTVKVKETPKEEVKFLMEWDETKSDDTKDPEELKETDRKKMRKVKKRFGIEEEEKKDVKIEIESEE